MMLSTSPLPLQYLYMGVSTRSSDHALFSSRLVYWLKKRKLQKIREIKGTAVHAEMTANEMEYSLNLHGWLWNSARFLNRLAEAEYRLLIAGIYQLQGKIVIYDRHFFFDSAPDAADINNRSAAFFDRLLSWIINHGYPKPSAAIFLDAPPEVLFGRKRESSIEYLSLQRDQYLQQGAKLDWFYRVDATQPLELVVKDVTAILAEILARKALKKRIPHHEASD
jgi:thymidylate kinase